MPDVSKIRLPGNTEVNIKDSRISGVDTIPTSGSENVVSSGGVYTSLQSKPNYAHLTDESDMPASPDASTLYLIDDDGSGGGISDVTLGGSSVVSNGVAVLPAYPTTVASMTDSSNYPKYVLLADEAAYTALATKDSGTLYLIPKT